MSEGGEKVYKMRAASMVSALNILQMVNVVFI